MTWEQVGVIVGAMAAWTVVHAYFVVPRIMVDCRREWKTDIEDAYRPVLARLDRLEEKIDSLIMGKGHNSWTST